MAAGSIIIDLLMKTGSFETDSKRAEKRLREMEKTAKQVGTVIGTAITAATVALTAMVKGAIDSADAMRDLSIRVGVDTETLSAYGYAATQTGTDIEVMAKGFKVLAKNAADAINPTNEYAKVFKALGIEVTDAEGKLRPLNELIPEIADRFKIMEDGTTKAALAQSLFGRAGLEMTEFLNQGSQGLGDFADKAADLGIIIDSETATAADNFNDTLGDLKAISEGYALHLAKELLPDLQDLAGEFLNTATEGNKVKEMAEGTAQFLRGLATVAGIVSSAFELVGTGIATVVAQGQAAIMFLSGDVRGAIALYGEASAGFNAEVDEAFGTGKTGAKPQVKLNFAGDGADPAGMFRMSEAEVKLRKENARLEAAVAEALSNPTATGGGKGKPKVSEAEKEAARLLATYDSLRDSQLEQIALFGDTTEAAKVRYATEHGELVGLTGAQKEALITGAERLDQMREEADLQAELDEADRRRTEAFQRVTGAIDEQLQLVRMSGDDQEIWNNLKWAGVDADSAWGQQLIDSTRQLQEQRDAMSDQIDVMDEIRGAGLDLFRDIREGKDVWDSIGDAIDRVAQKMIDLAAENLMDQIFGKQGDPAGGSTGGLFASLIGAFFGGGRAGGGNVDGSKLYEVGEGGSPELFRQNGRTFLIPGNDGRVVPATYGLAAPAMGGGSPLKVVIENKGQPMKSTGAQMETQSDGTRLLRVFVDDAVAESLDRGKGARVLEGGYGLRRVGVARG